MENFATIDFSLLNKAAVMLSENGGYIIKMDTQMLMNIAFHLVNTAVIILIMGYILYNPVKKMLANRAQRVSDEIDNANRLNGEAEKLKLEYEKKLKEIELERDNILLEARKEAHEKEDKILAEARDESQTLIKRANLDIQREKSKAKEEIKTQIIEASTLLASRYIAGNMDKNAQSRLLDEVIKDLGELKWDN